MLYAIWGAEGESPRYSVTPEGNAQPLAVVWRNPIRVALPVGDHRRGPFPDAGPDRCLGEGERLELSPGDWRVDGEPTAAGSLELPAGLHVLTRVETRADGFAVEDHAIVRIGDPPPLPPPPSAGCGCGVAGVPGRAPVAVCLLVLWAIRARRRGPARRSCRGRAAWRTIGPPCA